MLANASLHAEQVNHSRDFFGRILVLTIILLRLVTGILSISYRQLFLLFLLGVVCRDSWRC